MDPFTLMGHTWWQALPITCTLGLVAAAATTALTGRLAGGSTSPSAGFFAVLLLGDATFGALARPLDHLVEQAPQLRGATGYAALAAAAASGLTLTRPPRIRSRLLRLRPTFIIVAVSVAAAALGMGHLARLPRPQSAAAMTTFGLGHRLGIQPAHLRQGARRRR